MTGHQEPRMYPPVGQYGWHYPEQSQAVLVFVLGLLGLLVLPLLAPVAWVIGNREIAAIDAGRRSPENRGLAQIGRILGIVMSTLLILFVALVAVAVVLAFSV